MPSRDESLFLTQPSLTPQHEDWGNSYCLARVEVQGLYPVFTGRCHHKAAVFFCDIWLEQIIYCLHVFCLSRLPLPSSFSKREQAFLGLCFALLFVWVWFCFLDFWIVWVWGGGYLVCFAFNFIFV